ncbi:MAG: 3-deoxy-7-phosphoheptulonate synthase [Candidatus Margulisbacteria bacterium]|nr:3-deoxy-7-phosphoheptulonate synthase [Candidatus Margulisiibacteriota bacterium]
MAFEYIRKIPEVTDILKEMPLSPELQKIKAQRDREIKDIFTQKSNKLLIIIGPCSAHDEEAVCDYNAKLGKLQQRVNDRLVLVPRIYTNKPRTTGEGYKGMAHQPRHQEEPNMVEGLKAIRRMHIRSLKESGLAAADEMLYPENYPYLADVLSYVAIGARSVENQKHRLTVSGLDIPVGMKNPTSGDFDVMLNSVKAAQLSHVFSYNGWEVKTSGNPLAHCVLRGAMDHFGQHIPNYHYEDLIILAEMYLKRSLKNPAVIVDTNHSNSGKKCNEQPRIALEVLRSMNHSGVLKNLVKGFMIESFLVEGAQKANENIYGKSITDPCLGWESSEKLVLEIADMV